MVIYIKDLIVKGTHGYHDYEKTRPQRFKINLEMTIDDGAASSDDLEDTINWSLVRDMVVNIVGNRTFDLVERLAKEIANETLKDKRIQTVVVEIEKLDAFPNGVPGIRLEAAN